MIGFIHENWNMQGRPTVVLLLQENTLKYVKRIIHTNLVLPLKLFVKEEHISLRPWS